MAWLLGIPFQYFTIEPMRNLSSGQALLAAVKADTLSIITFEIGLFIWMGLTYFVFLPHPHLKQTEVGFWFMMQIGMVLGHFTSYPMKSPANQDRLERGDGLMLGVDMTAAERGSALLEQLLAQRASFLRFLNAKVGLAAAEEILQSCDMKLVEEVHSLRKTRALSPSSTPSCATQPLTTTGETRQEIALTSSL